MAFQKTENKLELTLKIIFGIVFCIKFLEALKLYGHGDALNYHLAGARLWLETSWAEMSRDLYDNFQEGIFQIVYLIPVAIFGNTIWAQVMAQEIHFLLSLGLGSLLLIRVFKKRPYLGYLAGITLLAINKSADFFLYAKNDGVLASMALLTYLFISRIDFAKNLKGEKRAIIIGLLLGLLPAIKLSGLYITLPLSLYYVWLNRAQFKNVLIAGGFSILPLAPIILRNWYFLKSPLFPGLLGIFPGNLTEGLISYYTGFMSKPLTLETFKLQLNVFFMGKAIFLIAPVLLALNIKNKKGNSSAYIIALITFGLYLITNGGVISPRFFFSAYFLTTYFIFESLKKTPPKTPLIIGLLLFTLVDSKIDKSVRRVIKHLPKYATQTPKEILRNESWMTKAWDYIQAEPAGKTLVISDEFAQSFYAPKGVRVIKYMGHPDAEFIANCHDKDSLAKLYAYHYAILGRNYNNLCHGVISRKAKLIGKVEHYKIYDLRELKEKRDET